MFSRPSSGNLRISVITTLLHPVTDLTTLAGKGLDELRKYDNVPFTFEGQGVNTYVRVCYGKHGTKLVKMEQVGHHLPCMVVVDNSQHYQYR